MDGHYCITFIFLSASIFIHIDTVTALSSKKVYSLTKEDRPTLEDWQAVNKHPLYGQNDKCPTAVQQAIDDGNAEITETDLEYDGIDTLIWKYKESSSSEEKQTTGLKCWGSPLIVLHQDCGTNEVLVGDC